MECFRVFVSLLTYDKKSKPLMSFDFSLDRFLPEDLRRNTHSGNNLFLSISLGGLAGELLELLEITAEFMLHQQTNKENRSVWARKRRTEFFWGCQVIVVGHFIFVCFFVSLIQGITSHSIAKWFIVPITQWQYLYDRFDYHFPRRNVLMERILKTLTRHTQQRTNLFRAFVYEYN